MSLSTKEMEEGKEGLSVDGWAEETDEAEVGRCRKSFLACARRSSRARHGLTQVTWKLDKLLTAAILGEEKKIGRAQRKSSKEDCRRGVEESGEEEEGMFRDGVECC